MFTDIDHSTQRRIDEAKWFFDNIKETMDPCFDFQDKLFKGNFFVNLYGAFEYNIVALVSRVIDKINEDNSVIITDLKPTILSLLLHDECTALYNVVNKKWIKRYELFIKIEDVIKDPINNSLMPAQTGNFKVTQIEQICKIFGAEFQVINDVQLKSRLDILADNRNAIAHGRKTACEVGASFTKRELKEYLDAVQAYCLYLNQSFYAYILNKHYLKSTKRGRP